MNSLQFSHSQSEHITDGFVAYAMQHPEAIALTLGSAQATVQLSYGEMLHRVCWAAQTLRTHTGGLHAGLNAAARSSRPTPIQQPWIALLLPNRVELLIYFLAAAWIEGVAVVLNPEWSLSQTVDLLWRWPPDVIVAETTQLDALESLDDWNQWQALGMQAIALPSRLAYPVDDAEVVPRSSPEEGNWLLLPSHARPFGAAAIDALPSSRPHFQHSGLSQSNTLPFYIGFTSGTTGQPKGVIRHHSSWVESFRVGRKVFGFAPNETLLVPGSLVHSLSLYSAVEALVNGASLYLLPTFHPKSALHHLTTAPITRLVAVPTLLGAIARASLRRSVRVPSVRSIISAGAVLSPQLRRQLQQVFPQTTVFNYYGASELSFISLASSQEAVPDYSVGRPFPSVTVSIRRDSGAPAPPGEIGQISIQSAMICSGYLEATDGTGFRIEQGWATVGDRGWMDEQGFLYLAGRERDMLVCNGVNVYPAEVEAALLDHEAIEAAVVLGLPDDCRGDRLCAVLKFSEGRRRNRADLIRYLRDRLEPAKCPSRWITIDEFPLTSSGKVNRAEVLKQVLEQTESISPWMD